MSSVFVLRTMSCNNFVGLFGLILKLFTLYSALCLPGLDVSADKNYLLDKNSCHECTYGLTLAEADQLAGCENDPVM